MPYRRRGWRVTLSSSVGNRRFLRTARIGEHPAVPYMLALISQRKLAALCGYNDASVEFPEEIAERGGPLAGKKS